MTGRRAGADFPTTPGAFQTVCVACSGLTTTQFVTELDPSGSSLVYSTFFSGGTSSIAVDAAGHAYVTGQTASFDLPTTAAAFQPACALDLDRPGRCLDAFVTKFNPAGSALLYSTYLGGQRGAGSTGDRGSAIAVDDSGHAYVTGQGGSDFPTTPGAVRETSTLNVNAFVTKLDPAGSALVYST